LAVTADIKEWIEEKHLSDNFSVEAEVWLAKCGLTATTALEEGLRMYKADSVAPRVYVPFHMDTKKNIAWSLRALNKRVTPKWLHCKGGVPCHTPRPLTQGHIVLTEDPMSAIAVARAGFDSLALAGTSVKDAVYPLLRGKQLIAWLDGAAAGKAGHVKLSQQLPSVTFCQHTDKEPKALPKRKLVAILNELIRR
jgi:hypothetical protein